ncbi:autotransporter outer membrane beta-barrel domain-containing protein [Rickettsia endosymbiont of Halotydeus destructor]|uniref:autotransporter outer membrane beta-barrel domain-containing protein n=1 Tax=Rickettsia endosymbiont of Halotydeus destructor TaxID=2996754 RepID=UPI003BAEF556
MAQKPSFLKRITTASTVAFAAAAIVGTGSSAFGADLITTGNPADYAAGGNIRSAAAAAPVIPAAGDYLFLGGAHDVVLDSTVATTINLYGNTGQTITVGINNATLTALVNDVSPAAVARAGTANTGAIAAGAAGAPTATLAFGAGPFNFNFVLNDVTQLEGVDFANNDGTVTFTGASNGLDFTKTIRSTGGVNGGIVVDVNNLIISGPFDAANKISTLVVNDTKAVTLNTDLNINGAVTLKGAAGNAGGSLTIGAGKNLIVADVAGENVGTGTLVFEGASTVTNGVGNGNVLNTISIGDGTVDFQGGVNAVVKATTISLTNANSALKLSTVAQAVTGNIVNTIADGNGSIIVDGAFGHSITGTVGKVGNSLTAINFNIDNQLTVTAPNNKATDFAVQNITTSLAKAANGNGSLILDGNYNIYSTIGTTANPLKLVSIVNVANAAATTTTLKTGNTINADTLQLTVAGGPNNILQLEANTTVNANITTGAANNGIITLTGASTINGDIATGVANSINAINLNKNNLTFSGANAFIQNGAANGIRFAQDETLAVTGTGDVFIGSDINVLTAGNHGIIDVDAMGAGKTLAISGNIGSAANSLASLSLAGGANLTLSAGDAYINNLIVGDATTVKLAHNTYKIVTTNTAGNGTVLISPAAAADPNATTLAEGTSLGTKDAVLKEIKFAAVPGAPSAATDVILNVGKDVSLYATNITNTTANTGSFEFNGGGTNIVKGQVGKGAQKFNTVAITGGTTAQFSDAAYFNGATTIDATSTLQIGNIYQVDSIQGAAPGQGTVEFVNAANITTQLGNDSGANTISTIKMSGTGNVILNKLLGAANIVFENTNQLQLAATDKVQGATITSNAGNPVANGAPTAPVVITSLANDSIDAGQSVGSKGNIVAIGLNGDLAFTVNEGAAFYGAIIPVTNNNGTVTLAATNGPNNDGSIYGLGTATNKLKTVNVTANTENFGDTYISADTLTIAEGITYTAHGAVDAGIKFIGANTGTMIFAADSNPLATTVITTANNGKGTVEYQGSEVNVGAIGAQGKSVTVVNFTGTSNQDIAILNNDIYSVNTNFGEYVVAVNAKQVTLNGISAIDNAIVLQTNTLTFNGNSTWGDNTSINTTLLNGTLGSINIESGKVTAAGNILSTVNISDQDTLGAVEAKYLLIGGGANLTLANGTTVKLDENSTINSNQRFASYSIIQNSDDKNYYVTRSNNATGVSTSDVTDAGFGGITGIVKNTAVITDPQNIGAAQQFTTNIGNLSSADSAQAIVALATDNAPLINSVIDSTTGHFTSSIANRVETARYTVLPNNAPERSLAAPERGVVGAADEPEDNVSYGAWLKPVYTDATQKSKGGNPGYNAKTTGGIVGIDTMANDNLMVGAAIGINQTKVKYKNYKSGDKTTVNGFLVSLYGAQQLVDNFFVQGGATFNLSQVKNKSQRYMADANGQKIAETATSNYDNMTFGGNVMFGYDAKLMDGVLLTPMAGLSYLKSGDESYKETGTTFQNKQVASKFSDRTDVVVGAKVLGDVMNLSGFTFYPEAHAFVTHKVSGKYAKTQSKLDGQVDFITGLPDKSAKTSYNVGLNVTARPGPQMEYGIGYDANLASKYVAHTGTLKVRVNF